MGVLLEKRHLQRKSFRFGIRCAYICTKGLIGCSLPPLLDFSPFCYCIENRLRAVAFARVELLIIKRIMCIDIMFFSPKYFRKKSAVVTHNPPVLNGKLFRYLHLSLCLFYFFFLHSLSLLLLDVWGLILTSVWGYNSKL